MENNTMSNECITSRKLMEVILELLFFNNDITGSIFIETSFTNGKNFCIIRIIIPSLEYYNEIKTKVEEKDIDILNKQILNDLLSTYLDHESITLSSYDRYITIKNNCNSKLRLDFITQGKEFPTLIDKYNMEIQEHINTLTKK